MKQKTLGQVAYEACPDGGQQNFGKWENAPEFVRSIHNRIAEAVVREHTKRMHRLKRRIFMLS